MDAIMHTKLFAHHHKKKQQQQQHRDWTADNNKTNIFLHISLYNIQPQQNDRGTIKQLANTDEDNTL